MLLCYIDESGTPEITGNSSHYILAGLAIPVHRWKEAELDINKVKQKYGLEHNEIHTAMIQIADLCAYAIRRYLENNETDLFDYIFQRVDINNGRKVGIRHFPGSGCMCKICQSHK